MQRHELNELVLGEAPEYFPGSYIAILTPIESSQSSIELGGGFRLRRSTRDEWTEMREIVGKFSGFFGDFKAVAYNGSETGSRYWLIDNEKDRDMAMGPHMGNLDAALILTEPELTPGWSRSGGTDRRSFGTYGGHVVQLFGRGLPHEVSIDASFAERFRARCKAVAEHKGAIVNLFPPLNALMHLRDYADDSPFGTLGYFALLESLITHQPDPKDPTDSLTRQIKGKMALLQSRLKDGFKVETFFDQGPPAKKLWDLLYSYRSVIAHGGIPEFDGKLKPLGDAEKVRACIRAASKSVIRQALDEPELIRDLKEV